MDIDELLINRLEARPFRYDNEQKIFLIGDDKVTLGEFSNYSHDPVVPAETFDSSVAIYNTIFGLVGSPQLFCAMQTEHDIALVQQDIVDTMVDAYQDIIKDKLPSIMRKPDSLWGFNIGLYRTGHPAVNVLGDCACMGVRPDPMIIDEDHMELGYMEFTMHNIDSVAQIVSLHAGLGRLAVLCES